MWLGVFVCDGMYSALCCGEDIDKLLGYILLCDGGKDLNEWQKQYKETVDKSAYIKDIRDGVVVMFKEGVYIELRDIKCV